MKILRKIKARSNKIFAYFSLFSMLANTLSPFAAMIPSRAFAEGTEAPVEVSVVADTPAIEQEATTEETADGQDLTVEEVTNGNEITEEVVEVVPEEDVVAPVEEVVDPEAPDIIEDGGVMDVNLVDEIGEVVEVTEIPTPVEESVVEVEDSAPSETVEPELLVVEEPVVEVKEYEYLKDGVEVIDSTGENWSVDGEVAKTVEKVKVGIKYIFPLDEDVSVTFTKLPMLEEDRAYLKIERVRVDALELPADFVTNAEYAFDITIVDENGEPYSDDDEIMNNGEDFEYDLTLPKPEGVEAEIVYIEKSIEEASDKVKKVDIEEIIEVVEEDIEQESDEEKVKVKDLDHFTIFIVTSPSGPTLTTATVNNQSQVTVAPNENITVSLSVTRDGSENWGSTRYQIDSGSTVCVNHNNHNGNGTDSEQFIIQAPNSIGTHNLTLWASTNDSCGGTLSTSYPMTNAIVVQALTVVANPSLSQSCGLDIALVLDVSGSIDSGELTQMKNAFKAFVDALNGTPTQFSVTQFSTTATILQGFTSDLNAVKSAINNASNSGGSSLYTNWEDGLIKSRSTFDPRTSKPNMMIFSSDGNPNRIGITGKTATESVAVSTAQIISNAIKSEGTRILGIGIGSDLDSANMQKLTGNNVNTGDVLTSDLITTNFAGLATQLANFAKQTCGGTITINKYIDLIQPGNLATSSWTFNTNITGHQSVQTTDGSVNISVPVGTGYSINEPSTLSGYTFANASCQKSTGGSVGTPSGNGVTGITMGADDIIYCNFLNTTNKGTMILEKEMVGGVSSFTFTGNPSGTISTNGGKITVNNVTPGTYTTTESAKTGWDLTSIVCDDGTSTTPSTVDLTSRSATFKVDPGETVTCKFTNTIQTGHIIVDKVTSPSGDPQSFSFIANGTGYNNFSLTDSTTPNNQTLNVGTYSVSEDTVVGWDQTSAVCTSSIQDTETPASLELDPGETITCTFTNSKLNINVIKTANPTSLPETGGNVEFTVKVENPSAVSVELTSLIDDKFGNLNTSGTCSVPQTISAGEYYECKFTENLAGNAGGSHTNIVTATASGVIDTDDATVSFNDVLPDISVTKTAGVSTIPETGGDVEFTYVVTNNGNEAATITVLSDDKFGALAGDDDCKVGTVIPAKSSCEFKATFTIPAGDVPGNHTNIFSATAEDGDGNSDTATDSETVTFEDVLPVVDLEKTVDSTSMVEPGGVFNYTLTITNKSLENVTITALSDSYALPTACTDLIDDVLAPGASTSCTYPKTYTEAGTYNNTASVTVKDNELNEASDTDSQSVGVTELPELTIAKWNDVSGDKRIGDIVTFYIRVTAHKGPVSFVEVSDLYSQGFEYVGGSWTSNSSVRGNLKSGITDEPQYNSPATWNLGDMVKDEVVTLTYQAEITEIVEPGLYKDLAWTQGRFIYGQQEERVSEAENYPLITGTAEETGYVATNFVGTEVPLIVDPEPLNTEVDVKEEEIGEVLGASTELPATGASTFWVNLMLVLASIGGLLLLIGGFGTMSTKKEKTVKKGKKAILGLVTLGFLTLFSFKVYAAPIVVRLSEPESPIGDEFDLVFVAMDIEDNDMEATCEVKKPGSASFTSFGSLITISAGDSGDSRTCAVTDSVLDDDGEYKFRVVVDPGDVSSNEVTVDFDGEGPDRPKYIEKEKVNDCVNKITLKTADDGETSSVRVYADDDKEIDIDDSHKIETEPIGPDEKFDFEHIVSGDDCDKTWYYAVVAFDDSGNASKPRSEVITTTTTTTEEGEEETEAIPVEGGAGIVEGGATAGGEGAEGTEGTEGTQGTEVNVGEGEEGSVLGEQTGGEGKVIFKSPWFWIVAVGLGIVIISAVKKSKKEQN